jgi:hypothetical protein
MGRYRTKVQEVEAIQFRTPLTISGSSDGGTENPLDIPQVNVGDWLLTHPDGNQECVTDEYFKAQYEEVTVVRRGRPPKHRAEGSAVAAPKRRRRHRAKNGRRKDAKVAA